MTKIDPYVILKKSIILAVLFKNPAFLVDSPCYGFVKIEEVDFGTIISHKTCVANRISHTICIFV